MRTFVSFLPYIVLAAICALPVWDLFNPLLAVAAFVVVFVLFNVLRTLWAGLFADDKGYISTSLANILPIQELLGCTVLTVFCLLFFISKFNWTWSLLGK
jgi:hypothetical protein